MDTKDICTNVAEMFKGKDLANICSNNLYNKIKEDIQNKK